MGEYMVGDYNYVILARSIHPTHLILSVIIYETRMITETFSAPPPQNYFGRIPICTCTQR